MSCVFLFQDAYAYKHIPFNRAHTNKCLSRCPSIPPTQQTTKRTCRARPSRRMHRNGRSARPPRASHAPISLLLLRGLVRRRRRLVVSAGAGMVWLVLHPFIHPSSIRIYTHYDRPYHTPLHIPCAPPRSSSRPNRPRPNEPGRGSRPCTSPAPAAPAQRGGGRRRARSQRWPMRRPTY